MVSALGVWNLRTIGLKLMINFLCGPRGKVYQKAICQPMAVNSILAHWFCRCTAAIQTYKNPCASGEQAELEVSELLQLIGSKEDPPLHLEPGICKSFIRDVRLKCFRDTSESPDAGEGSYEHLSDDGGPAPTLEEWVTASDYGMLSSRDVAEMVPRPSSGGVMVFWNMKAH